MENARQLNITKLGNANYFRFMRRQDIAKIFGVTTRTIQRWEGENGFPRPMRVGRSPYWLQEDIEKFTAAKIAQRGAQS